MRMFKKEHVVILLAMGSGCLDAFTVENLDPIITSIDPVYNDAGNLRIDFTVNDFEGDDTSIIFEICEGGGVNCGFAEIDPTRTDLLSRIHTQPKKTNVRHSIVWDVSCGRLNKDGTRLQTDGGTEYLVKLAIKDQTDSSKESENFVLNELNIGPIEACEK